MRGLFLAAIGLGLLVGGAAVGIRWVLRDDPPGAVAGAPAPVGSAQALAETWAKAWAADDLDTLYLSLSPDSQREYTLAAFTAAYRSYALEMTATDLTARLASIQGGAARLAVRLETAYFGDFEYTTALNLVRTGERWVVAWDPSAIHPSMTATRSFRSTIERSKRGAILDRNGAPLAVTQDLRFLGLNRSIVTDRDALRAALINFGFSAAQVDAAFESRIPANQRVAVGPVPDARAEEATLTLRTIPGVLLYFESKRLHPLGGAAAHIVGYTREITAEELAARKGQGARPGDRVGAVGLERALDEQLGGKTGAELRLVEEDGTTVEVIQSRPFVPGRDVTTTLDAKTLETAQARLGKRAGAAVVLDPRTNAVLAINSSPTFDPDAFERGDSAALQAIANASGGPQSNRATAGLYSAGSTFKLVTGAAGLVYGGYRTSDAIFCGAVWDGVNPPRKNWEGTQGPLTIAQGLMRSCNPVFYEIGLKLHNDTDGALSKMAREFGFGAATGLKGLAEEDGLIPDAGWKKKERNEQWFPGDEVNLAIGQGDLLITPLQLANAYSTFITGSLRNPVVVAGEEAVSRGTLPLTLAQANHLREGLRLVTSAAGTARAAFADAGYFDFAGKSGTAEDIGAQQHVLFVAYSPANAPRAVAAVVLDEGQSGSIEAGPIARDIVLAAIR